MHHRHALLSRYRRRELVADRLYESAVVFTLDVHLFVLGSPATKLTFDVVVVLSEVTESRLVNVDVVQRSECRGEVLANDRTRRLAELAFGVGAIAQDCAVDELHHVKGPVVHRFVRA